MSRIKEGMKISEAMAAMSEEGEGSGKYNIGAVTVLGEMLRNPLVFLHSNPAMNILQLDTLGIYGSHIWELGKYCCNGSLKELALLLMLNRFGKITEDEIHEAISSGKRIVENRLWSEVRLAEPVFDYIIK